MREAGLLDVLSVIGKEVVNQLESRFRFPTDFFNGCPDDFL